MSYTTKTSTSELCQVYYATVVINILLFVIIISSTVIIIGYNWIPYYFKRAPSPHIWLDVLFFGDLATLWMKLYSSPSSVSYLLVQGHICWDEDLVFILIKRAGCDVWRLEQQVTDLLLEQLLRYKRILSNPHRGATRQWVAIPVLQCLGTMESWLLWKYI